MFLYQLIAEKVADLSLATLPHSCRITLLVGNQASPVPRRGVRGVTTQPILYGRVLPNFTTSITTVHIPIDKGNNSVYFIGQEQIRRQKMTNWLLKFWCRADFFICGAGLIGNVLLLIGLVTAALNISIAGFTPIIWILLAFILYVTMIFSVVLRIMTRLESKQ